MDIITILKANIKDKKGAFTGIVILMMIITMALTAIISNKDNINKNLINSLNAIDTGDVVAFMPKAMFTDEMKTSIKINENVERIREVSFLSSLKYNINEKEGNGNPIGLVKWEGNYSVFDNNGSGFIENPEKLKEGEMYVPLSFKILFGCKINNKITIETKNGSKEFVVKGFIEEPFLGAYLIGIKQAFISEKDYNILELSHLDNEGEIEPKLEDFIFLNIYKSGECTMSIADFRKDLNEKCGVIDNSYATLNLKDSMNYTTMFTDISYGILYVFIILLFIIVLIVMGHSISTGIEMDYVNLGILKSQGFTKGKIRIIFILQYVIAEVIGAALGILIAIPLTGILGRVFEPIVGIFSGSDLSILKCSVIIGGIIFIGGVFVFIMTHKIGKISPLRAISGGRDDIYFDSRLNFTIKKSTLHTSLAFRQFISNKKQYIGTIIIVSILVYFMMSITILADCMGSSEVAESFGIVLSDLELELNNTFTKEKINKIESDISKIVPITSSFFLTSQYISLDGIELFCTAYENPEAFTSVQEGRIPLYKNEIIITEIVEEEIGKSIGDKLKISNSNKEEEYMISGIYQSASDVGRCIGMSFGALERLGDAKLNAGRINISEKEKIDDVKNMLNDKYGDVLIAKIPDNTNNINNTIDLALNLIALVIYIISIVFGAVVVNMVCSKTFLKEKCDIGIYKAVGFTTKDLRMQFAIRFLTISFIGSAIGVILCLMFNKKMLDILLRATGITNFATDYTLFTFLVPMLLISVCFFIFAYMASRKIKTVAIKDLVVE